MSKNAPPVAPPSPYKLPKSPAAAFFWRRKLWFESTFALSMLEPWEKMMLVILSMFTFLLVLTGVVKYFPEHLFIMQRRVTYYLIGQEGEGSLF